jgi:hypothetical protein
MDHLPVGTESKSHFHEKNKVYWSKNVTKIEGLLVKQSTNFQENERFFTFPEHLFHGGVFLQNIFSPKAAGWTQPLASENHENVENHAFQRFCHFVRPNGPDTGSRKMRNVFPVISVQSILPVAIWNIFILFVGTVFAVCFRKYFLTL